MTFQEDILHGITQLKNILGLLELTMESQESKQKYTTINLGLDNMERLISDIRQHAKIELHLIETRTGDE